MELIALNLYQGGMNSEIRVEIVDRITKELIRDNIKDFSQDQVLKIGLELQKYANFMDNLQDRKEWNDLAVDYLKNLEFDKSNDNYWSCMDGIASCFLSMANYYAEQVQEEEQEDLEDSSLVCTDCESAIEYLKQGTIKTLIILGLSWTDKALEANGNYAPVLATRGEILIYLSDIQAQLENSKESEIYYKDAIESFRKCQAIDPTVLPDQFFDNLEM